MRREGAAHDVASLAVRIVHTIPSAGARRTDVLPPSHEARTHASGVVCIDPVPVAVVADRPAGGDVRTRPAVGFLFGAITPAVGASGSIRARQAAKAMIEVGAMTEVGATSETGTTRMGTSSRPVIIDDAQAQAGTS